MVCNRSLPTTNNATLYTNYSNNISCVYITYITEQTYRVVQKSGTPVLKIVKISVHLRKLSQK